VKKIYWPDAEFTEIVTKSKTISDVLKYFGLPEQQPHYRKRFYYDVRRLSIDLSHMGTFHVEMAKKPNDGKSFTNSKRLKERLLKAGIPYQCANKKCKLATWLNAPISLHLDHIDGDRGNNNTSNLRFLCPNCHSQTDTYTNKNVKNRHRPETNPKNHCTVCNKYRGKRCKQVGMCMACWRAAGMPKVFKNNGPLSENRTLL